MRTFYYFLIGVILFYIDTLIGLVIPLRIGNIDIILVPHLTLMYLLMLVVYRGFGISLIMAIVLGAVTDVYFGSLYGLYLFGYILFIVIMEGLFKIFYRDHVMTFFIILILVILLELYVALIYGLVGFVHIDAISLIVFRLLPTLVLNGILLIILYPLLLKFTKKMSNAIDSKNRQW